MKEQKQELPKQNDVKGGELATFKNNDVREDDVEKLAANLANPNVDKTENWKEGYLYAKENTYTEEQVREAIEIARRYDIDSKTIRLFEVNEIIQSLKQPKQ